jgi:hypothetical protein
LPCLSIRIAVEDSFVAQARMFRPESLYPFAGHRPEQPAALAGA